MMDLAYVNGTFMPLSEAKVSVEDRGFQFGDAVYEVVIARLGTPFLLTEHLARLRRSAEAIDFPYDFDKRPLAPIVMEGVRRSGRLDATIYIQLSRGVARRNHIATPDMKPTVVMTFRDAPHVHPSLRERGARLITVEEMRWTKCYIKAVTLLPNVLAKTEAVRRGCDDALFVTDTGEVRECTSANIFAVCDGRIFMPVRSASVLHGITQQLLLNCANATGMTIEEKPVSLTALLQADEVFLSSTVLSVLGVTSIDDHTIADGRVGPATARLEAAYQDYVTRTCGGRPPAACSA